MGSRRRNNMENQEKEEVREKCSIVKWKARKKWNDVMK